MGLSSDMGVRQQHATDIERNGWQATNNQFDDMAALIPVGGVSTGKVDAGGNGFATITHGLNFTPAMVVATGNGSNVTTQATDVIAIDNITATTFRVRFRQWVSLGGGTYKMQAADAGLSFKLMWIAYRAV